MPECCLKKEKKVFKLLLGAWETTYAVHVFVQHLNHSRSIAFFFSRSTQNGERKKQFFSWFFILAISYLICITFSMFYSTISCLSFSVYSKYARTFFVYILYTTHIWCSYFVLNSLKIFFVSVYTAVSHNAIANSEIVYIKNLCTLWFCCNQSQFSSFVVNFIRFFIFNQ